MSQPAFDWSGDVNKPVSGRTSRARHASATGAQAAAPVHGRRTLAYLEALRRAGADGLNDDAAAALLGIYRTSVCSIRNALIDAGLVAETGRYDVAVFGARSTRRQRYALTAAGRAGLRASVSVARCGPDLGARAGPAGACVMTAPTPETLKASAESLARVDLVLRGLDLHPLAFAVNDAIVQMDLAANALEAAHAELARIQPAQALIRALQAWGRECGWQDVDGPLQALLDWEPPS